MSETEVLAEGDVVDHKVFGIGTVKEVCRGRAGPDDRGGHGYRVTVEFADPPRTVPLMDWALKKVSSPDTRPFVYWDRQWQPLHQQWLNARREVELVCKTFEPAPDESALAKAIEKERSAWQAMQVFIAAPRS